MATFFMFGKYSPESVKKIETWRTDKVVKVIENLGGKVKSMYALLGDNDLIFIVELPNTEFAMKASISLTKLTDISFTTLPAVAAEDFDKLFTD